MPVEFTPRQGAERTLALIKPDAVAAGKTEEILQLVLQSGFTVTARRDLKLTEAKASEFYAEHQGKEFFSTLVEFMTSGPLCALALAKQDAVRGWRELIGPTNSIFAKSVKPHSIRALYGTDGTKNASHGSANITDAKRELEFFFPAPTQAAREANTARDSELRTIFEERLQPALSMGITFLAQQHRAGHLPDSLVTALGQWLIDHDPVKHTGPQEATGAATPDATADAAVTIQTADNPSKAESIKADPAGQFGTPLTVPPPASSAAPMSIPPSGDSTAKGSNAGSQPPRAQPTQSVSARGRPTSSPSSGVGAVGRSASFKATVPTSSRSAVKVPSSISSKAPTAPFPTSGTPLEGLTSTVEVPTAAAASTAASVATTPATTVAVSPAASVAATPAASVAATPAASVAATPAAGATPQKTPITSPPQSARSTNRETAAAPGDTTPERKDEDEEQEIIAEDASEEPLMNVQEDSVIPEEEGGEVVPEEEGLQITGRRMSISQAPTPAEGSRQQSARGSPAVSARTSIKSASPHGTQPNTSRSQAPSTANVGGESELTEIGEEAAPEEDLSPAGELSQMEGAASEAQVSQATSEVSEAPETEAALTERTEATNAPVEGSTHRGSESTRAGATSAQPSARTAYTSAQLTARSAAETKPDVHTEAETEADSAMHAEASEFTNESYTASESGEEA